MSYSSTHALSTQLFLQAAITALLAPLMSGGMTWLVITLAVAAGAVGLAMLVRRKPVDAKVAVVGFEAAAVTVGAFGIAGGHYIPGTIVGITTLISAFTMHADAAPDVDDVAESESEPESEPESEAPATSDAPAMSDAPAPDAPPVSAPAMDVPAMDAPVVDNPYAPPAVVMSPPAAMASSVSVMAPPATVVVPEQAAAPEVTGWNEAVQAPDVEAAEDPQPEVAPVEVTKPMRPEDIPPAQRTLTVLPGR